MCEKESKVTVVWCITRSEVLRGRFSPHCVFLAFCTHSVYLRVSPVCLVCSFSYAFFLCGARWGEKNPKLAVDGPHVIEEPAVALFLSASGTGTLIVFVAL